MQVVFKSIQQTYISKINTIQTTTKIHIKLKRAKSSKNYLYVEKKKTNKIGKIETGTKIQLPFLFFTVIFSVLLGSCLHKNNNNNYNGNEKKR